MLHPNTHINLLIMSFVTWLVFVLIGLPDYYQSWSFNAQVIICVLVTVLYFPLTVFILNKFGNQEYIKNSLWLAFYLTLPLFIYDYVYIVLIKGDDISFVFRYWYLSFFYFSFWIQFPLVGWLIKQKALDSLSAQE
ncbi:conserved membrane hypothetical protein [Hyella patelloides LEGE 07179]|uniref:Uncharacterized protein n=2 Tax=Hyella TaxID=945733 RepID=A0A563VMN1_9CYAN|nr:conserved membrane hypothetical protein [Hyella patelloides LEGE 07179]